MTKRIRPKVGTAVRTTVRFSDFDGHLASPQFVTCTITEPDGTSTDYIAPDVVTVQVGVFQFEFLVDSAGKWQVIWTGGGFGPNCVNCTSFIVDDICT
jgi:hypothetical protein